jgi:hypothetical protein
VRSRPPQILSLLLAGGLVFLAGCGLERVTILLTAPIAAINAGVEYFQFDKTTTSDVEPEFRGFELYYRFYDFGVTPDLVDTYEELIAAGYRRVNDATDTATNTPPPLIAIHASDRATAFTVIVDFSSIQWPVYPDIYNETPPALSVDIAVHDFRRAVTYPLPDDSEFKRFSDFLPTDADIKGLNWDNFQDQASLDLYVLSYGWDIALSKRLYSEPVWLGTITTDFVTVIQ